MADFFARLRAISPYGILVGCFAVGFALAVAIYTASNVALQNDLRRSQEDVRRSQEDVRRSQEELSASTKQLSSSRSELTWIFHKQNL